MLRMPSDDTNNATLQGIKPAQINNGN